MFLASVILGQGVRILIDIGATHNAIDINFSKLMSIMECHINIIIMSVAATKSIARVPPTMSPYASKTGHSIMMPYLWT